MEAEELNPFSFREFLRWKNQDPDPEQARTEVRAAQLEVHLCPKAASTNTEWVCAHSCDTRVHVYNSHTNCCAVAVVVACNRLTGQTLLQLRSHGIGR